MNEDARNRVRSAILISSATTSNDAIERFLGKKADESKVVELAGSQFPKRFICIYRSTLEETFPVETHFDELLRLWMAMKDGYPNVVEPRSAEFHIDIKVEAAVGGFNMSSALLSKLESAGVSVNVTITGTGKM